VTSCALCHGAPFLHCLQPQQCHPVPRPLPCGPSSWASGRWGTRDRAQRGPAPLPPPPLRPRREPVWRRVSRVPHLHDPRRPTSDQALLVAHHLPHCRPDGVALERGWQTSLGVPQAGHRAHPAGPQWVRWRASQAPGGACSDPHPGRMRPTPSSRATLLGRLRWRWVCLGHRVRHGRRWSPWQAQWRRRPKHQTRCHPLRGQCHGCQRHRLAPVAVYWWRRRTPRSRPHAAGSLPTAAALRHPGRLGSGRWCLHWTAGRACTWGTHTPSTWRRIPTPRSNE
jgi:hypothetical protein